MQESGFKGLDGKIFGKLYVENRDIPHQVVDHSIFYPVLIGVLGGILVWCLIHMINSIISDVMEDIEDDRQEKEKWFP